MKISFHLGKYRIRTAQKYYVDLLSVVNHMTPRDIESIAEVSEDMGTLREEVSAFCNRQPIKLNEAKLVAILADGVFTLKRSGKVTLSRRGKKYNTRVSRMLYNYDLAKTLAIECHLKNKLLEKENDKNKAAVLGL